MKNKRIRNTDLFHKLQRIGLASITLIMLVLLSCVNNDSKIEVSQVFERIATHDFNPMNEDHSMTLDLSLIHI